MQKKQKITNDMERDIIELFSAIKNPHEATAKFNKKWNTNFNKRTLQQRYSNYTKGFKAGIEANAPQDALELLAKKELRILTEQKKNVILRQEAHKVARMGANEQLTLDNFNKRINELSITRLKPKETKETNINEIVFFKGDDHFRGTEEDKKVQREFYETIYGIANKKKAKTISLIFGGDEIEGYLHVNTLKYTPLTPEEQMISFVEETISGLDLLTSEYDVDLYLLTSSNHTQTRHLNSGRNTFLKGDLSILMEKMLKTAYRNNVRINIYSSPIFRNKKIKGLGNKKVAITHGGLKFESNVKELVNHYNECDLILKAHTHVFDLKQIKNTIVITTPTLKTFVTDYEISNGYVNNKENFNTEEYKWDSEFLELKVDGDDLMIIKRKCNGGKS